MDTHRYTFNPETGRRILVGGALFCQLLYNHYDYLNGDLVRRMNNESDTQTLPKKYYFNTITNRYIRAGGRRFKKLLNEGWKIEEDRYLRHPLFSIL